METKWYWRGGSGCSKTIYLSVSIPYISSALLCIYLAFSIPPLLHRLASMTSQHHLLSIKSIVIGKEVKNKIDIPALGTFE